MATVAKSVVDSLREVMQDLLVPELKAVKVSVDSLRNEMKTSLDSLRTEMKLRDEKMEQLIRLGDEKNEQAIRNLSEKLDFAIDIRERLATLEARTPRQ
ncbi:MAG: hypothetical protein ABI197_09760 [Granulicella sp.]